MFLVPSGQVSQSCSVGILIKIKIKFKIIIIKGHPSRTSMDETFPRSVYFA